MNEKFLVPIDEYAENKTAKDAEIAELETKITELEEANKELMAALDKATDDEWREKEQEVFATFEKYRINPTMENS